MTGQSDNVLGRWTAFRPDVNPRGRDLLHEGQQSGRAIGLGKRSGDGQARANDYYTDASSAANVSVLEESAHEQLGATTRSHGEVLITSLVTGYRKIKLYTHEVLGWGEVALPEQETRTAAYWLSVSKDAAETGGRGVLLLPNDYGRRGTRRGTRSAHAMAFVAVRAEPRTRWAPTRCASLRPFASLPMRAA
jgi:hypothetical protein